MVGVYGLDMGEIHNETRLGTGIGGGGRGVWTRHGKFSMK